MNYDTMGEVILNVDLSQAELRVMAIMSDDPWMIAALQVDSGDFFTNHLMPVAFPGHVQSHGGIEAWKEADPKDFKERRVQCKSVMYGLAFGRQARAIGIEIGQPTHVAQGIIDALFRAAPKFLAWRRRVEFAAIDPSDRDFLVSPFGRRYQREVITSRKQEDAVKREALSFLPQSTASDICLTTAIRIDETLEANGFYIFNVVHDAIMLRGDSERVDEIGQFIGRELALTGETVLGNGVPFLSDYSWGTSWADLD